MLVTKIIVIVVVSIWIAVAVLYDAKQGRSSARLALNLFGLYVFGVVAGVTLFGEVLVYFEWLCLGEN